MDSDGDGLADFFEIELETNPLAVDTDGDGYNDFEETLGNTFPNDTNSVPADRNTINWQQSYDLRVHPQIHDMGNAADPTFVGTQTGTFVRVYDHQGLQVAEDTVVTVAGRANGVKLFDIPVVPEDLFTVATTPVHFFSDSGTRIGREVIGIYTNPTLSLPEVDYTYQGSNQTIEAGNYGLELLATFPSLGRLTIVDEEFDLYDSLAFVVTERIIGDLLFERGVTTNNLISLAPFRDTATRYTPSEQEILSLQIDPGYRIHKIINTVHAQVATNSDIRVARLRDLAEDVYRISGLQTDTNTLYASPIKALRDFVQSGDLPGTVSNVSYAAETSLGPINLSRAFNASTFIRNLITPRPTVTLELEVASSTYSERCTFLIDVNSSDPVNLIDDQANPYTLPGGIPLPPGSILSVTGYTDRPGDCGGLDLEVISITLLELPQPGLDDADGNLLSDEWELALLGSAGADALGDRDLDGYSDLEESLAGTDPTNAGSTPAGAPLNLAPPEIEIETLADGSIRLFWDYPGEVSERIGFQIQTTDALGVNPFIDDSYYGAFMGGEDWQSLLPVPSVDRQFFAFRMYLR
jgi:hypothetical protein